MSTIVDVRRLKVKVSLQSD